VTLTFKRAKGVAGLSRCRLAERRCIHGFNHAYNARRQRVLGGVSPNEAVRRRLEAEPCLVSGRYEPPSDPCVLPKALLVVEAAKDVSHPES
jgi:hypothetical protein